MQRDWSACKCQRVRTHRITAQPRVLFEYVGAATSARLVRIGATQATEKKVAQSGMPWRRIRES